MNEPATDDVPTLPTLDSEVTVLATEGRTTGALQSLVLDHMLLSDGTALWVDARGNAATTSLARIAPSKRTLDRIHVARGFTAFQHYSIVDDLPSEITEETSLIVAPSVEWFYANDDLRSGEGEAMLRDAMATLQELAATHDVPVLVSRATAGELGACVLEYVDTELECITTSFGPRFVGDDFDTLVFECNGGVQTTFAFWRRVLEHRHSMQASGVPQEVSPVGTH